MIKVSLMWPNEENSKFDIDYYINTHARMVQDAVGDALKGYEIEEGVCGRGHDDPPSYVAIGHMYYESVESYINSFVHHIEKLRSDIPNFTDVLPTLQVSKVKVSSVPGYE